jgi:hypothetical protein
MKIDLGGPDVLVPEPHCDHRCIDAGVEELHGGGVPQNVGSETLRLERRALQLRHRRVFGNSTLNGVTAEPSASAGREQGIIGTARPLCEPKPQGFRG